MGLAHELHANTCIFLHFTYFPIVSHCEGVVLSRYARMLLITAQFPIFDLKTVHCVRTVYKYVFKREAKETRQ